MCDQCDSSSSQTSPLSQIVAQIEKGLVQQWTINGWVSKIYNWKTFNKPTSARHFTNILTNIQTYIAPEKYKWRISDTVKTKSNTTVPQFIRIQFSCTLGPNNIRTVNVTKLPIVIESLRCREFSQTIAKIKIWLFLLCWFLSQLHLLCLFANVVYFDIFFFIKRFYYL